MTRGDYAVLSGASLRFSNLSNSNLIGADLRRADLQASDLRNTKLNQANLTLANLAGADLHGALFWETILARTNLGGALGLDRCRHGGPSVIDHRTLKRSGPLPLSFLQGCGLPDIFIEYLPSLLAHPLHFFSVFISYSSKDEKFARQLHRSLQKSGVRCWFAPHDLRGGKKLHDQIEGAILVYDRLLLVLSEHSMNSEWVKHEIANARRREVREECQVLFPITLVPFEQIEMWNAFDADIGKDMAREIREYFIPDFSGWKDQANFKAALHRLLRDLKSSGYGEPARAGPELIV